MPTGYAAAANRNIPTPMKQKAPRTFSGLGALGRSYRVAKFPSLARVSLLWNDITTSWVVRKHHDQICDPDARLVRLPVMALADHERLTFDLGNQATAVVTPDR
jgi:hypothetical protein